MLAKSILCSRKNIREKIYCVQWGMLNTFRIKYEMLVGCLAINITLAIQEFSYWKCIIVSQFKLRHLVRHRCKKSKLFITVFSRRQKAHIDIYAICLQIQFTVFDVLLNFSPKPPQLMTFLWKFVIPQTKIISLSQTVLSIEQ